MNRPIPELLVDSRCELGENPLWNVDDQCIYWEDITGGRLHRFNPQQSRHEIIYEGERVGGFTFQANGELLLFRVKDIALLRDNGAVEVIREYSDPGMERFNDVIADPAGRVYAGTIGKTAESGGVYLVELDATVTKLFAGTGCSNGMGFSMDSRTFYWTCSTTRRILEFDYNLATGQLSNSRVLYQADEQEGIPDGMTIDIEGNLWSARWDGYALVKHAHDGTKMESIPFPVAKVSSVCFGGADLDELFITTAGGDPKSKALDGGLFHMPAGVKGRPEFRSRIKMK